MAGYAGPPAGCREIAGISHRHREICQLGPPHRASGRMPAQRGIALMLVLWVLALLTIIAVGLTMTQRTESTLAANQIGMARFRALAEAGLSFAVINLTAPPALEQEQEQEQQQEQSDVWIPDGSIRPWSFAGETLEIIVSNEGSMIDLNQAPRELLIGLFTAVQAQPEEVDALVDAILDWRDENDLHLLNGAEDEDYRAAGRPHGAKDGPFDSVEELRQVLGVDRELYRAVAPVLTVDAGSRQVVQELAPLLVQAALQGITLEEAGLMLQEGETDSDPGARTVNRGGPRYRIRVNRVVDGEPTQAMEALVGIDPGTSSLPFRVVWRRYGLSLVRPEVVPGDEEGLAAERGGF